MNNFIKNNALPIALAGGALYLVYKLSTVIKSPVELGTNSQSTAGFNAISSGFQKDPAVRKAMTPEMYSRAESLEVAFTGYGGFGTDEDTVFRSFDAVKTPAEIKALYCCYGQRYISGSMFSLGLAKVDLSHQTKASLGKEEFARVSNKLKLVGLLDL